MKRLTEIQSAGYDLKELNGEWCNKYCEKQKTYTCNECGIYQAIQKLAHYEDLEEQGRLISLPCKVGDTVYHVVQGRIVEVSNVDLFFLLLSVAENRFNNSVFLTQANAEQKLKELKKMKTHNGITE